MPEPQSRSHDVKIFQERVERQFALQCCDIPALELLVEYIQMVVNVGQIKDYSLNVVVIEL